ncbi:family 43 glycosylhydrolase [Microbacterium sp. Sa4CUA7]|uniref:Family 43 glycosylhydrolase n=1 Tax=Microbacterium pullorum TaxID=2762236 RepID=A0ABR8RZ30_9MICO|nr:glycoside hydrolase 43 family protein [Microbacterium pullorum]MBD7956501.1 family 43 glycosylhydrolase [Microbacterium pullorum]
MNLVNDASSYRNPIIDADVPDPDAIRVGDRFYLVASSFHRAPGLPLWVSDDLVAWERVGYALAGGEPAPWFELPRHGGGVWAPSIRHHDGRFFVVYPDPDQGIFVVTAEDPAGPWSAPHALLRGLGIIDPCPLWDDDGNAYLVHGWAHSRSGRKNVLTVVPVDPQLRHAVGPPVDVIDGDRLEGFTTLEGPKFYQRDGRYWIFAPAGGVATGWQTVFRADDPFGPYEHRIVLAQGDTPVNGPHQGAWVDDGHGGDWFLHFQDRGVYGRVLHLQPMAWGNDGWPTMGQAAGGGDPQPVIEHAVAFPERGQTRPRVRTLARPDDFADGMPGTHWQWEANPDPRAIVGAGPGLGLRGNPEGDNVRTMPRVLSQPLPGMPSTSDVDIALESVGAGSRAGIAVLGEAYLWAGVRSTDDGFEAVVAVRHPGDVTEGVIATSPLSEPQAHVRVQVDADAGVRVVVTARDTVIIDTDPVFRARPGRWVGASLSLFAAGPRTVETVGRFAHFSIDVRD